MTRKKILISLILATIFVCCGFYYYQASGRPGDPAPSNAVAVMGTDGTTARMLHTDSSGNLLSAPAGTSPGATDPIQGTNLFNSQNTSAANATLTFTITGAAGQRSVIRAATGVVSGAGTCTVTIQDGATVIMTLPPLTSTTTVSLFPSGFAPATGISASSGNSLQLIIGACGAGVTSTVAIVGDRQ